MQLSFNPEEPEAKDEKSQSLERIAAELAALSPEDLNRVLKLASVKVAENSDNGEASSLAADSNKGFAKRYPWASKIDTTYAKSWLSR